MDRSNWDRVVCRRFIKKTDKFFDKNCVVGLLILDEVNEPLILDNNIGNYKIVDNGYKWLQIAVEKENYWVTAMFDDSNNLIQIYFDITDCNVLDSNPYFDDLFIDIVLYNDNLYIIDQDELLDAYNEGVISSLQYDKANNVSLCLYDFILNNRNDIINYCYRMLDALEMII